jgi:hypothetical protein
MATKQKITNLNGSQSVRLIQELALKAMQKELKAYGITVKALSGTRGETAKLRFEFIAGTGKAALTKSTQLAQIGSFLGLTVKDIGKTFVSNGRTFRFDDVKVRRYKFPISATDAKTGKQFKFSKTAAAKINPAAAPLLNTLSK